MSLSSLLLSLLLLSTVVYLDAVPMETLRSFAKLQSATNATAPPCIAVIVEENRLLASSSYVDTSLDTATFVHDVSLTDDANAPIALAMQSTVTLISSVWKNNHTEVFHLHNNQTATSPLLLPRNESFPSTFDHDESVSIVEIDTDTMHVSVLDGVVYANNALCGGDNLSLLANATVCVLPHLDDGGTSVPHTGERFTRFLMKNDTASGSHILLGLGVPIADPQDGFRLFTWLRSNFADPSFSNEWTDPPSSGDESDRVLGPPVPKITRYNEFIVGIRQTKTAPNFCAGSLIRSRYVLTAAHCAYLGNAVAWVVIGALDKEGSKGEHIEIKRQVIHPQYKGAANSHDFMLLELKKTSSRTPIKLSSDNSSLLGQHAMVMGYGSMAFKDGKRTPSTTLRSVEIPVGPALDACAKKLQTPLDNSMLCAGGEEGKDSCIGDSGGPLVLNPGTDKQELVGLVSFGLNCGIAGYSAVYARASLALQFITDTTGTEIPKKTAAIYPLPTARPRH